MNDAARETVVVNADTMLIASPRSRLRYVVEFVLTALAWVFFGWLCVTGMMAIIEGRMAAIAVPFWSRAFPATHTLLLYLGLAAVNALVLFGWARYNRIRFRGMDRRKPPPPLSDEQLLEGFRIEREMLDALRQARVAVIHHTEEGGIARFDVKA